MSAPELPSQISGKWLMAVFWVCLMASLTLFFNGFVQQRDTPNANLKISNDGSQEVVLLRNRAGHYFAPGKINGHDVEFLLDTGATDISVPEAIAHEIGLTAGRRVPVSTANGVVNVYQTKLSQVQLGNITMSDIRAHINPHANDDVVLLGMSFMKHLDITQRNGSLTLRVPSTMTH